MSELTEEQKEALIKAIDERIERHRKSFERILKVLEEGKSQVLAGDFPSVIDRDEDKFKWQDELIAAVEVFE